MLDEECKKAVQISISEGRPLFNSDDIPLLVDSNRHLTDYLSRCLYSQFSEDESWSDRLIRSVMPRPVR